MKLLELREYVSDKAHSMSGSTSTREINRIVRAALSRLDRVHRWQFKRRRKRFLLAVSESGTANLGVTNESATITLTSGGFPSKYYDESWTIRIGDSETLYGFAEPPSGASAKLDVEYEGTTDTDASWTAFRSVYELPSRASTIYSVRVPNLGVDELRPLSRDAFDDYREAFPTTTGQPWVYTVLNNEKIEIWPAPASTDYVLEVSYQEEITLPSTDTPDEEDVDWPDDMSDLLWSAIKVCMIEELGAERVRFDVGAAMAGWNGRRRGYQDEDQQRTPGVFDMTPPILGSGGVIWPRLNLDGPIGTAGDIP